MKKLIAMLLALVLVLSLAACGAEESDADLMITRAPETATEAAAETKEEAQEAEVTAAGGPFVFAYEGTKLTPGDAFDVDALPAAESVYTVPSCALEGTDNVYSYGAFELTAFDEGSGEVIYSIYFLDPELTTPEGLALGDSVEKMAELYGEDYAQDGDAYVYTREDTVLSVIAQDGLIASIEYRLDI